MAVFRIEKTRDYTVMSNHHLRNENLSLKSKGLLSMMLSLPENWNYTTRGLASICKEGTDSIGSALKELERAGYIVRNRLRDEKGKIVDVEYVIYETPHLPENSVPHTPLPDTAYPDTENPDMDNPCPDNTAQLNKDIPITQKSINDLSSTDSIPFSFTPFQAEERQPSAVERKRSEAVTQSTVEIYQEIIRDNIEYDHLVQHRSIDRDMLDEIVDLILETVCTARKTIRVAGDEYPAELVKAKFLKLNCEHIEFVMDCMRENTTEVRNIKKYLLAVLFNAPSTIGSYYTAKVNHDLYGGG